MADLTLSAFVACILSLYHDTFDTENYYKFSKSNRNYNLNCDLHSPFILL